MCPCICCCQEFSYSSLQSVSVMPRYRYCQIHSYFYEIKFVKRYWVSRVPWISCTSCKDNIDSLLYFRLSQANTLGGMLSLASEHHKLYYLTSKLVLILYTGYGCSFLAIIEMFRLLLIGQGRPMLLLSNGLIFVLYIVMTILVLVGWCSIACRHIYVVERWTSFAKLSQFYLVFIVLVFVM